MQRELDLAGVRAQRCEAPEAGELAKRAVREFHINTCRPLLGIVRGEMLLDALEINVDFGFHPVFVLPADFDATAPGKEIGVVGHVGDEVEHLFRRMAYQHGFLDICHKFHDAWQEWTSAAGFPCPALLKS